MRMSSQLNTILSGQQALGRGYDWLTFVDKISQVRHDLRLRPVRLQPLPPHPRSVTEYETIALLRLYDVFPPSFSFAEVSRSEPDYPPLTTRRFGWIVPQELLIAPLECSPTQHDVVIHDHNISRRDLISPVEFRPESLVHAVLVADSYLDGDGVVEGELDGKEKVGKGRGNILPDDEDLTE